MKNQPINNHQLAELISNILTARNNYKNDEEIVSSLAELISNILTARDNYKNDEEIVSSDENICEDNQTDFLFKGAIGKWVIVRTRNEGLNFGKLLFASKDGCVLADARRLHRPISKDESVAWYEGISISGMREDSRISCAVDKKFIVEDYSITTCTQTAIDNIKSFVSTKTTYARED